jgi:hypothetical protein
MKIVGAVIGASLMIVLAVAGSDAATTGPATPTNLEVVSVTEDSVTLAWGPSQPGEFTYLGTPKKNTVLIGWGASEDSRTPGSITYSVVKDGTTVATGLTSPQYRVSVGAKTTSFRVCVTAANGRGQLSPETCGTFTKG